MKRLKRFVRYFLIIVISVILFKGLLYNLLFSYHSVGTRNYTPFTPPPGKVPFAKNASHACKITREYVNQNLQFSSQSKSQNPNDLLNTHEANCIGYTALFTAYYNWLADANNLNSKAKHHIGKIHLFKFNLHQLFNTPFFEDHDFVIISDSVTKSQKAIDPTISDYLDIDYVSTR